MPETPWLRQDDEPEVWYQAFGTYLSLPDRTVHAAYGTYHDAHAALGPAGPPGPPEVQSIGKWLDAAVQYQWRARAAAHDRTQRLRSYQAQQTQSDAEWREAAQVRVLALRSLRGKVLEQLKDWTAESTVTLAELTQVQLAINRALREELAWTRQHRSE